MKTIRMWPESSSWGNILLEFFDNDDDEFGAAILEKVYIYLATYFHLYYKVKTGCHFCLTSGCPRRYWFFNLLVGKPRLLPLGHGNVLRAEKALKLNCVRSRPTDFVFMALSFYRKSLNSIWKKKFLFFGTRNIFPPLVVSTARDVTCLLLNLERTLFYFSGGLHSVWLVFLYNPSCVIKRRLLCGINPSVSLR